MRNSSLVAGLLVVAFAAIVNVALAASTISTNIQTDGTLNIATTTSSTAGVINKGGMWFLQDYADPTSDGHNLFMGLGAGNFSISIGANPTYYGSYNLGIGESALRSTTNGYSNTAIGYHAGSAYTTGNNNTVIGNQALPGDATGFLDVAIGSGAMQNGSGIYRSVGVGAYTLLGSTAGDNTAVGYSAAGGMTNGTFNTAIGENALNTNTTGVQNTALGYGADVSSNNLTNATALGYNAKVGASNALVLGGTGSTAVKVGIGTTTPATRLQISSGASATTTVTVGELGLTSSKACVNMNAADGSASSFYISAAHTLVVEAHYCN